MKRHYVPPFGGSPGAVASDGPSERPSAPNPGWVNVPIVCAGATVNPGDIIVGDPDGVVVVKREAASEVARLGQERLVKEAKTRERLRNGELGLDFYGLRERLKELGVDWVDEL